MRLDTLRSFIAQQRDENAILEANGATAVAKGRAKLLRDLEELLAAEAEETLTVEEAASLTGAHPETVRRMVRDGELDDLRSNPRGTMRIPRSGLDLIRGKVRKRPAAPQPSDRRSHAIATLASL